METAIKKLIKDLEAKEAAAVEAKAKKGGRITRNAEKCRCGFDVLFQPQF